MRLTSLSKSVPINMDAFDPNISLMYGEEQNKVMRCVKVLLVLFNLVCLGTGIILIYSGVSVLGIYSDHAHFVHSSQNAIPPTLLIVLGVLVSTIAFMGLIGVLKESVCMILSFSFLLGVIFMFEISISLTGLIYQTEIRDILSQSMSKAIHAYPRDPMAMQAVDTLQYQLSCCGVESPADWRNILTNTTFTRNDVTNSTHDVIKKDLANQASHSNVTSGLGLLSTNDVKQGLTGASPNHVNAFLGTANPVRLTNNTAETSHNSPVSPMNMITYPNSCCANGLYSLHNTMGVVTYGCGRVYDNGCLDRMDNVVKSSGRALVVTALTVALIQFLGIIFACFLGKLIRVQKTERETLKWEFRNHLLQTRGPGNFETFVRDSQTDSNKL
uniref:Tetraspanin-33 n=1 Tax=Cacopsylla melanoneura TaxID=428564 RepID=A0A8D8W4V6_9HEMI